MKKRLLIVDDEPRLVSSFKLLFENKGFWIQTASNGPDAIELFNRHPFKVVLSDIQMDGMDGIEMMHALKKIDPCVQVIFLTGFANVETASRALKQNNAFEYLIKPVKNMNSLYTSIEQAENKYDREKHLRLEKEKNEKGFAIFKDIFDSMEAAVYVSDMKTHELIYANKKTREAIGYDAPLAIEGAKCWEIIQKGQSGPCPFCTNNRLLNFDGTPGAPYEWEFQNTVNNRWYSIVDKAILWYDKRIVRLETAFDITEKKEHEKLFREFEKAIESSKKLESIGTLAGGVAHDINNTLSAIIGNINLAQLCCPDNETQKYLGIAEKGIMQAKGISAKLITFAKGGRPLKTKTNIEKLLLQAIEKKLDPEKITSTFESEPIFGSLYADPEQLKIAIENILQNSLESMDGTGRIDVMIRCREHALRDPQISISISDSGCGIPQEHLDMIFNPYFTTKPLNTKKSTGLGLSVAWSIIARHGGKIQIESTVKKGTRVLIFLPVTQNKIEKDPQKNIERPIEPIFNKTTTRVLVMDDDELILEVISQLLKRLGYETLVATTGNQAIEIFEAALTEGRRIDIVLLDFDIKTGLGGFPTMDRLKEKAPNIKGIIITGHSNNAEIKKYRDYGFSDILEKPFSIKQLNKKIKTILGR